MDAPNETNVWIGLDIGKADHFADVLDNDSARRRVANDEPAIAALLDRAASLGSPALVVDQTGSLAQLVITVAARRGVPVAYVPGLVMRRAADLYPGEAKTDRRDAFVLADFGRTRRRQLHWIDCSSSCASWAATTPTSPPTRRGPAGCAHQCFPGPSACWAPGSTAPAYATCLPATPRRRRAKARMDRPSPCPPKP